MATYVNDLRLKEISTGDESGTWGTSTNTNLELIGEALGYATQQVFSSDADATTTVADGASDPARAMYFKITSAGNLTATRTCTIAPNTVSRVMFIENATSGSQSIAISQGSGANVTIATGKTAVVYLDGAGSGAAVVDAMAGVDPGVTDTLAEVLTAGNTTTTDQKIQFRDSAIYINSSADGQLDIVADTEIQIAATTVDLNGNLDVSGTTVSAGKITADAGIDIDNINIDGTTIALSSGDLTLDVAGNIRLDADDNGEIRYLDGGTQYAAIKKDGNNALFQSIVADGDFIIQGIDGASFVSALTFDMSEAGAATFNAGITTGGNVVVGGTLSANSLTIDDITINSSTISDAGNLTIDSGGDIILDADGGDVILKDGGTEIGSISLSGSNVSIVSAVSDEDIFFKGNDGGSSIDALFLDMSAAGAATFNSTITTGGNITIGNTSLSQTILQFLSATNGANTIHFGDGASADAYKGYINYNHTADRLELVGSGDMLIDVAGEIQLDSDSGIIRVRDAGGDYGMFQISSSDFIVRSMVQDKDLLFKGNDGGSIITALSLDMSEGGNATFSGNITATAAIINGQLNVTGTTNSNNIYAQQVTTQFDTSSFMRFHPTSTTDSGGFTNIFFGTSTVNNYGVAVGGKRAGTDGVPSFEIRMLNDSTVGEEVLNIANSGDLTISSNTAQLAGSFTNTNTSGYGMRITTYSNGAEYGLAVDSYGGGYSRDFTVGVDGNVNVLTGNLVIGTAGKGIDFSATAGSGTSELLDDYEEGTWTPTIRGSATAGTYTYLSNVGTYTKVGRMVSLSFYITNISVSSAGSGYLQIIGAPFEKRSNTFPSGACALSNVDMTGSTTWATAEFISASATSILYVRTHGDNVAGVDLAPSTISSGASDIRVSICYETA